MGAVGAVVGFRVRLVGAVWPPAQPPMALFSRVPSSSVDGSTKSAAIGEQPFAQLKLSSAVASASWSALEN